MKGTVGLTFDVDWAHDDVLAETITVLERAGARATFFATHASPLLLGLDRTRYELAIHPNFNPLLEGQAGTDYRRTLDAIHAEIPEAVGVRSHSLTWNAPALAYAAKRGMRYESNLLLPTQLAPFREYDGLVRLPIYWCDFREVLIDPEFATREIAIDPRMPAVFLFHPIHVFLNTEHEARYASARPHANDPIALRALRNESSRAGVRDYLVRLLERVKAQGLETVRLRDMADAYDAANGLAPSRPPSV